MTKVGAVNQHHRKGDQKRDEVHAILGPDAVHQPYTVVVMSRNTGLTEAAMLAARWLEELAGATSMPGVKKDSIVRIASHLFFMVLRRDK
jgi:hypothetical protein